MLTVDNLAQIFARNNGTADVGVFLFENSDVDGSLASFLLLDTCGKDDFNTGSLKSSDGAPVTFNSLLA